MRTNLYPLVFHPIYKKKPWGGRLLAKHLNRQLPAGAIGESWDIAAHPHGQSVVANGPLAGRSLQELLDVYGPLLVGREGMNPQGRFPLLLKFIHAQEALSIQVHPGDGDAAALEGEPWGKSEVWYILHSDPGAWIIWGLRPGVTKGQLKKRLDNGQALLASLNKIKVRPGEIYPISAGLVHALGPGVVVAEIQQNSDLTYRLYDWGRLDAHGRPRALHLDQALAVTDFSPQAATLDYQLQRCQEHFRWQVLRHPDLSLDLNDGFLLLTSLEAVTHVFAGGWPLVLEKGQSSLVPAALETVSLQSNGLVLLSKLVYN